MALIPIHTELIALAGNNPAGYIHGNELTRLTLDNLVKHLALMEGKQIPAGNGILSAKLSSSTWDIEGGANLKIDIVAPASGANSDYFLDLLVNAVLTIDVDTFLTSNPNAFLSKVTASFSNLRIQLEATNNRLVIQGCTSDSQVHIVRYPDSDQIITDSAIDPLELARVEGQLSYDVIPSVLRSLLASPKSIALSEIFPTVDFGGAIKLAILDAGRHVGIIPTGQVTLKNPPCTCALSPELGLSESAYNIETPADPQPNTEIGTVLIGGPLPEDKNPDTDFGERVPRTYGPVGLFLPRQFAERMMVTVMPAIDLHAEDDGFIGFDADATVSFLSESLSFDESHGGILIDFDFKINVSAFCFMHLLCVPVPLGWAVIKPNTNGHCQVAFYASDTGDGTIMLKGMLSKADMGTYIAVVIGIGTALKLIGITAWLGFLIDTVLSLIVSRELPIAMRNAIGKAIIERQWDLIRSGPFLNNNNTYHGSTYDVGPDSILISRFLKGDN